MDTFILSGEGYKKGYTVQFLALNCLLKITAITTSDSSEANKILLDSISNDNDSIPRYNDNQGKITSNCMYTYS
jgi:hypothetical protein